MWSPRKAPAEQLQEQQHIQPVCAAGKEHPAQDCRGLRVVQSGSAHTRSESSSHKNYGKQTTVSRGRRAAAEGQRWVAPAKSLAHHGHALLRHLPGRSDTRVPGGERVRRGRKIQRLRRDEIPLSLSRGVWENGDR